MTGIAGGLTPGDSANHANAVAFSYSRRARIIRFVTETNSYRIDEQYGLLDIGFRSTRWRLDFF